MLETLPPEFWQGVEQFNQAEFYACHDTLEAIWMESAEPEKKFYQGILQIAVGCYHLLNGNQRGAMILLGEGSSRLQGYEPTYASVDVADLRIQSLELLEHLQSLDSSTFENFVQTLKKDDRDQLPKIHHQSAIPSTAP